MSLAALLLAILGAAPPSAPGASHVDRPEPVSFPGQVVIEARIRDRVSEVPIRGARVLLLSPDSVPVWHGITGDDGVARSPLLAEGVYLAEAGAPGYGTLAWELGVEGEGLLVLDVHLVPEALELDPVVVEVRRESSLARTGFLERRARGMGTFIDRAEIEARRPLFATDLLRTVPGVTVGPGPAGHGRIASWRGCAPQVVLDGYPLPGTVSVDDVLAVADIEGIEVHSPATQPASLSRSPCGSILLWSRDGRDPGPVTPWNRTRTVLVAAFFGFTALLGQVAH